MTRDEMNSVCAAPFSVTLCNMDMTPAVIFPGIEKSVQARFMTYG